MAALTLRPAVAADAAAIATVHLASWEAVYRGLLPDALLDQRTLPAATEQWIIRIAEADTLLALDGDTLLGFCECLRTDPPHIRALYLDPGQRRRGIGGRLVEATAAALAAAGAREVTLDVLEGNTAARAFYARTGFVETGDRDLWHGTPQVRLLRTLTS